MNADVSVLGILNAVQHHQPLTGSGLGHAVVEIDKIAVSLWPILFAAVVAQSLRMYAAWQVERGILLIVSLSRSGVILLLTCFRISNN